MVPYNRDLYGGWIDADGDCQNTRQEVLIEESLIPVELDSRGCRVQSGEWFDPFTGQTCTNPGDLDIDHFIPLAEAGGINTGVAIYNTATQAVALNLTLQDVQGKPVPNGETNIEDFPANGHLAQFLGGAGEVLFPDANTENFQGTLVVRVTGGNVAAAALELGTQTGEFTTLPVTPLE